MRTARALERHLEEDIVARHCVTILARRPSPPDAPSTPLTPGRSGRGRRSKWSLVCSFQRKFWSVANPGRHFSNRAPMGKGHGFRRNLSNLSPRFHIEAKRTRRSAGGTSSSERAAATSDAPLARVRVGLDDAGVVRADSRVGGDTQVAGRTGSSLARPSTESGFPLKHL